MAANTLAMATMQISSVSMSGVGTAGALPIAHSGFGCSSMCGATLKPVQKQVPISRAALVSCNASYVEEERIEESDEELRAAYEELYGPAFGSLGSKKKFSMSDDDDSEEGGKARRGRGRRSDDSDRGRGKGRGGGGEFEERIIQVRRVTKVVKGGKQLSFRAVVVVGNRNGMVGVGVAKAKEVVLAVQKAVTDAKRHLVPVKLTKYKTFPHRANGRFGSAEVMLRPAATGTGVIAGGAVRVVLELAGVENALGKELGSGNPLNNARAVLDAVSQMKQFQEVATARGIPMEDLWK